MSEITMLWVRESFIGYGRMGTNIAAGVRAQGVTVHDGIRPPEGERDPDHVFDQDGQRDYRLSESVAWLSVPAHARGWYEGQHICLLTMWESTRLPETFHENLDDFDTLIVPSQQNVELFSQYHPDVRYCPLGIDTEKWAYRPRRAPETRFNYLIGGSGARKGTDLAVRAFRRVWPDGSWPKDGPVPHLVLKSPRFEDFYGPRIERVGGFISAEEELDLYADAHVYLQPSRGEGFGLQPLQAIASGIPTILTNAHGHAAFAHLGIPIGYSMAKAYGFSFGDAGQWWEPDFDELCEAMFWAYHHYDEATDRAAESSRKATAEFTWERASTRFLDCVGRDRLGPYAGSGKWYRPRVRQYPVVTNRDWICDIAGTTYIFRKGERLYAPADVKRILFDANVLDAVCLDNDGGLTPEQLAALPAYVASQQFCPTCHQQLGSGTTRADEILAQEAGA